MHVQLFCKTLFIYKLNIAFKEGIENAHKTGKQENVKTLFKKFAGRNVKCVLRL